MFRPFQLKILGEPDAVPGGDGAEGVAGLDGVGCAGWRAAAGAGAAGVAAGAAAGACELDPLARVDHGVWLEVVELEHGSGVQAVAAGDAADGVAADDRVAAGTDGGRAEGLTECVAGTEAAGMMAALTAAAWAFMAAASVAGIVRGWGVGRGGLGKGKGGQDNGRERRRRSRDHRQARPGWLLRRAGRRHGKDPLLSGGCCRSVPVAQ